MPQDCTSPNPFQFFNRATVMKQKIIFAMVMGIITTGIISFSLIALNVGFSENFIRIWLKSWVVGYFMVVPIILTVGPQLQKLIDRLVKKP